MPEKLGKHSGIYCIENIKANKIYIGSSYNLRGRIYNHLWHLDNNIHCNNHLQNSYNKHGGEDFLIFELESCDRELLTVREQAHLNVFLYAQEYILSDGKDERFHHYGYNISPTANRTTGFKHSDEDILQMIEQGKLNWQNPKYIDAQNKVRTGEWHSARMQAVIEAKQNDPTHIPRLRNSLLNSEYHKSIKKPILAYYRETGEFAQEFDGINEAARLLGIDRSRINKVLSKRIKYTDDVYFDYKTSNIYPLKIDPINQYNDMEGRRKAIFGATRKNCIPILAYKFSTGEFVGEYGSQRETFKKLGAQPSTVLRGICSQINDYTFKYKDPNYVSKKKKSK